MSTEIPYSSSQTLITKGTWWTAAALITSKNKPSLVLALPIVPQAISFPFTEWFLASNFPVLYNLEAIAKPNNLGIWPPVGEISDEELYCLVRSLKEPSLLTEVVAKCEPICLPPDIGSSLGSVLAYNAEKISLILNSLIASINVWSL